MWRASAGIAVLVALFAAYKIGQRQTPIQTAKPAVRSVLYYVDPMHPSYRSNKPGIAPDCGMRLEPVYAENASSAVATDSEEAPAGTVNIEGATQKLLGVKLAAAEETGSARMLRVVGRVVPEDTRTYRLNAGVDGFIRETFDDSVGKRVKKDQKLATYYAPDFVAVISGFLAASERVTGMVSKEGVRSMQNYSDRLRNLGMSDAQISQIAETHQQPESVEIDSPADGFILSRSVSAGQHFMRETEFYRIADLSQVWVAAEVYEQEAARLRPGTAVQVMVRGQSYHLTGHVSDSLPESESGGNTVKVRLEVANPQFVLRPDMLVDVEMPVRVAPAVTVPVDAIVDSGATSRVYVARGETAFEPREVKTGWRFGDRVEILHGLKPGEQVVASATFLVDSESRLKAPPADSNTKTPAKEPVMDMPMGGGSKAAPMKDEKANHSSMPMPAGTK